MKCCHCTEHLLCCRVHKTCCRTLTQRVKKKKKRTTPYATTSVHQQPFADISPPTVTNTTTVHRRSSDDISPPTVTSATTVHPKIGSTYQVDQSATTQDFYCSTPSDMQAEKFRDIMVRAHARHCEYITESFAAAFKAQTRIRVTF